MQTDMRHSEPQQALISIPLVVSVYFAGMDCGGYVVRSENHLKLNVANEI